MSVENLVIGKHGRFARLLFVAILGLGVVIRVAGAWWYAYDSNPDYGVVVLMVRNIIRGIDFPVFFYGQAYMGSLEPLVSAGLALLFGSSPFVVCLGTSLIALGLVLAVYRLALRVAGPLAAGLAAALCLIGPPGYFHYMSSPRGGYALGLLLTILLLHKGMFLPVNAEDGKRTAVSFFVFGFLGGLGFLNFWLTLPALLAAGLILIVRLKGKLFSWNIWLSGVTGFFIASLPWWIWNVSHGWTSLSATPPVSGLRTCIASVHVLLTKKLPEVVGVSDVLSSQGAQVGVYVLVSFLVFLPFVVMWLDRPRTSTGPMQVWVATVLLYTGVFVFVLTFSSFGKVQTPRYLLPLVPVFTVYTIMRWHLEAEQ